MREIVYRTQTNIDGLRFKGEPKETYIVLKGTVARVTQRKLFGFIPLPDKWMWDKHVRYKEQDCIGKRM